MMSSQRALIEQGLHAEALNRSSAVGWDAIPAIIAACEPTHAPEPPEQLTFSP